MPRPFLLFAAAAALSSMTMPACQAPAIEPAVAQPEPIAVVMPRWRSFSEGEADEPDLIMELKDLGLSGSWSGFCGCVTDAGPALILDLERRNLILVPLPASTLAPPASSDRP